MSYKIGDQEFEPDTTVSEMYEELARKKEFKEFAQKSFKTKTAQDLLNEE